MPARTSTAALVAAGFVAAALVDALIVLAGAGRFDGPPLGIIAAPLLLLLLRRDVRRALADDPTAALLALGAGWILAPFVDQHLTGAVALDGAPADFVHHMAASLPLVAAAVRLPSNHIAS
jgi:hypothetical protein